MWIIYKTLSNYVQERFALHDGNTVCVLYGTSPNFKPGFGVIFFTVSQQWLPIKMIEEGTETPLQVTQEGNKVRISHLATDYVFSNGFFYDRLLKNGLLFLTARGYGAGSTAE